MVPAAPDDAQLSFAILQVADRISGVLREERALIGKPEQPDFETIVARKSHLALELARLNQQARGKAPSERVRLKLDQLSDELAENARLIQRHMTAVREVYTLVVEAIEASSADGTYTNQAARRGATSW